METPVSFTIVIPTRNRPASLAATLRALAGQTYPRDAWQIVVVDDGSDSSPEPVLAEFRNRVDITLIPQSHAGPAAARNRGAAHARGAYLAFTDDDCRPAADWLAALAKAIPTCPDAAWGGDTLNGLPENLCSAASQWLIGYLYAYYNSNPLQARFLASNNLALPRARFLAIDGFDATFPQAAAEDRDLCDRWLSQGYPMFLVPAAKVYHAHPQTAISFWRQHFAYGRGASHFRRLRAKRSRTPVRVEPLSFYLGLLRGPFSNAPDGRAGQIAGLMVVAQMANAAGFAWQLIRHGG